MPIAQTVTVQQPENVGASQPVVLIQNLPCLTRGHRGMIGLGIDSGRQRGSEKSRFEGFLHDCAIVR